MSKYYKSQYGYATQFYIVNQQRFKLYSRVEGENWQRQWQRTCTNVSFMEIKLRKTN